MKRSVEEATVLELYREPVGGVNRRTKEPFHFGAVSEELKGGNLYLTIREVVGELTAIWVATRKILSSHIFMGRKFFYIKGK